MQRKLLFDRMNIKTGAFVTTKIEQRHDQFEIMTE